MKLLVLFPGNLFPPSKTLSLSRLPKIKLCWVEFVTDSGINVMEWYAVYNNNTDRVMKILS